MNKVNKRSNSRDIGNIFNHPLLKFYHQKQAVSKKESIDLQNYKYKNF